MSTRTTASANTRLDSEWGTGTAGGFFVAALTAVTNGAGGVVTEASGGSYIRQEISFAAAAARSKASNVDIEFPVGTVDHGNIVAWGVYAAAAGGSPIHVVDLDTPIPYDTGFQPVIESGDLTVGEAAYVG